MLIEVFIVLVLVAAGFVTHRLLRPRLAFIPGPRRVISFVMGKHAGPRPGLSYVPDAGHLTRVIVRGMVRLGYQSFTVATRVLDPNVVVTGCEVDIETIRHFEPETRAEIVNYVEQKGGKYRWALNAPPTFSYRIDPKVPPGTLVISRASALAVGDAAAYGPSGPSPHVPSSQPQSWSAWYEQGDTDHVTPSAPSTAPVAPAPSAPTRADPASYDSGGWRVGPLEPSPPTPVASDASIGRTRRRLRGTTRYVGGRRAGQDADSGMIRLFRVGGGNVFYHLKPGVNRLGRDFDACDIVCAYDDAISNIHLEFGVTGTEVRVRDLDSLNGTKLNGRDLVGTETLRHGDELCLGETRLRLIVGSASLAPTHDVTSDR